MTRRRCSFLLVFSVCFSITAAINASQISDEPQPSRSIADPALEAAFQRVLPAAEPAQRLAARFTERGAFLEEGEAEMGLRLVGYGYGERLAPPVAARPEVSENRITYRRGRLTEWYVNSPAGLEQGFTITSPPSRPAPGERLVIALEVTGGMQPALAPEGDAVLLESGGVARMRYSGLRAWDARGRELDARLDVRGREVRLTVADAGAAYPLTVDPWIVQAELVAPDGAAGDGLGSSVAASGGTTVIGAAGKANAQGAAYVFTRSNGVWQELVASDGAAGDFFGNSAAVSGDTAVIGALGKGNHQGAAYVFTRSNGVWSQQQKLLASDGAAGDWFGTSVAVTGDTMVIGAVGEANGQGAAYVFTRSNGVWSQQQKLLASGGVANDQFGISVAADGNTAVIGAPGYFDGYYYGAAYVFTRSNGIWSQQQKLVSAYDAGDELGRSVAVSGNTALLGAPGVSSHGAAYVFTCSNGVWSQPTELQPLFGIANDQFGYSVAVSGDTAVLGTPGKAHGQGAAYVFTRSYGMWVQSPELMAFDGVAGDEFGGSVAVDGNTAVIAASAKASSRGAAYVFSVSGLQLQSVGSSSQFQSASLAAFQLAGAGAGHWTYNGGGQVIDSRQAGIVPENGNLTVVWDPTQTIVWTYLSVDSVVANRAYFAQPRTTLNVTQAANTAGQNLISSNLWGVDSSLPPGVLALIQGQKFNAAFTDLLPADAKFAQNRVNCGTGTTATMGCLGYGTADPNIGTAIQSAFSTAVAHPVNFGIYGADPITGNSIPGYTVVPIGISPLIMVANRGNPNGLGQQGKYQNMNQLTAQLLFTGTDCDGTAFGEPGSKESFAINPILREPLSGTMNTFEFNIMVQNGQGSTANGYFSQESIFNPPYFVPSTFVAIQPAANNPLNGGCPGGNPYAAGAQGKRIRTIGMEESVAAVRTITDSIGYLFFGYGNVSSIANDPQYGYLTYQAIDPINPSGNYATPYVSGSLNYPGNGQLPICTAPCPIPPGKSFPNIRTGAYRAWSVLRALADTYSAALADLEILAGTEANLVNGTVPDFLPFNATADGDLGFLGYRTHFAPSMAGTPAVNFADGNIPYNGIIYPNYEAGGDVGGCLEYKTSPYTLNCRY